MSSKSLILMIFATLAFTGISDVLGAVSVATELIGVQSEVRKVKGVSEAIQNEVKRVKEISTGLQNDMKRVQTDLRSLKATVGEIEGLLRNSLVTNMEQLKDLLRHVGVGTLGGIGSWGPVTNGSKTTTTTTTSTSTATGVNVNDRDRGRGSRTSL